MNGTQCSPSGRSGWLAVAALCALLSTGGAGRAAVHYVNQAAAGPVHDGTSWATAFTTVGAGLGAAASGDEIWVAKGTYLEASTVPAGVSLYGGFVGTETGRTERNWTANPAVLDGAGSTPGAAVVTCLQNTTVDGFIIRNGNEPYTVFVKSAEVTLSNNNISGNNGEGVYVYSGSATLTNNTISGNALNGVRVHGSGTATLSNNTIVGNAIHGVDISGPTTLSNNTISGNSRNGVSVSGTATLSSNTVSGNGNTGVYVYQGTATLSNNTISGNGGHGVRVTGTWTLTNNIVAFNGGYGLQQAGSGNIPTFSHNDVFGNAKGEYSFFTPPDGKGNISLDPKLSSAYRNVHIQPDSPCRDAGDDSAVLSGTLDIDGQPRLQGSHVDIGSDESDGTVWSVPPVTWHVAETGDDGNDGRTWATAVKKVTTALSLVQGADEVWVAKGTYTGGLLVPSGVSLYGGFAGTETSRDERDWTANPTVLDGAGGSVVTCLENTVVDGFTLRNGEHGVLVNGTATLSNNTISGNGNTGVSVNGTATLSNNTISSNGVWGVYISGGKATLSRNTISGNNGDGVSFLNYASATLSNNTISGNTGDGVYVDAGPVTLSNNTISGNSGDGVNVYFSGSATLSNNVSAFNGGFGLGSLGSITAFSHNDVYGNTNGEYSFYTPPSGQGNISLDPLFMDRANSDFHLQSGSPCIDAGDDTAVDAGQADRDGKPRIQGAHVDIGAYEVGAGPAPFTMVDVGKALGICSGLLAGTEGDLARLDVEPGSAGLDLRDALCLARKVAGLDSNP